MVYTSDPSLRAQLQNGAKQLKDKASQFQIAPTLLQLMGYRPEDIATVYDESLLMGSKRAAAFTSGDVFGLFSSRSDQRQSIFLLTIWNPKQKNRTAYREQWLAIDPAVLNIRFPAIDRIPFAGKLCS